VPRTISARTPMIHRINTLATALLAAALPAAALETEANVPVEFSFESAVEIPQPDTLEMDAVFTTPSGAVLRVPAFWAGGRHWKIRYASPELGEHEFVTATAHPIDGLDARQGTVEVGPYRGDNPLFRHGPLKVSEDRRHFVHADGTPFLWLGDTWWMGLSARLDWPEGFQELAADRRDKGFNVIQIVGGLPPDMPPLDPRGAGDAGQAWTDDFSAIRPEFYDAADQRIRHLVDQGLTPCIVAAWKHYLPVIGTARMKRHWRNLVARYGAWPVVWAVGGEINQSKVNPKFLGGLEPALDTDPAGYRAAWSEIAAYLDATDPFQRILGAHNQNDPHVLDDPALLDMYFLQSGHSALGSVAALAHWFDEFSRADHRAPLLLSEANYQNLFNDGSYGDQLQRHQYWAAILDGAAGVTYGANGIWQVNQTDQPFGPSPHGFTWGNTPWPEAMAHPASTQLGQAHAFLKTLPWTELVPIPGQARFVVPEPTPLAETRARWIEIAATERRNALVGASFELPEDGAVLRATLRIATRSPFSLSANGAFIHRANRLDYPDSMRPPAAWLLPLVGEYLEPGRNRLMLEFRELELDPTRTLIAHLEVVLEDGRHLEFASGPDWTRTIPDAGWPGAVLKLDPADWDAAPLAESRSDLPSPDFTQLDAYGPRAAKVPGELWLLHAPAAVPVELSGLPPESTFSLESYDPRDGALGESVEARSDTFGRWTSPSPEHGGDRVYLLRAAEAD